MLRSSAGVSGLKGEIGGCGCGHEVSLTNLRGHEIERIAAVHVEIDIVGERSKTPSGVKRQ